MELVGISFKDGGKVYYFMPGKYNLKRGITVIVETEQGLQFGKVIEPSINVPEEKIKAEIKPVIRIATKNDFHKHISNLEEAKEALEYARDLALSYNINMQLIDATYTFDKNQLIFRFISDNRVDFRNLVKDLAAVYKTRIELRQVGVRDRAKEISGCGICGQKLCCSRFLNDLDSVSINMAKNQNLSLNPTKINGCCGRLLCCLKYEDETYSDYKFGLPSIGSTAKTKEGTGKVVSINILRRTYKVDLGEKGLLEVNADEAN